MLADLLSVTTETMAAFALTALIIEITPGPNMAYLVILAMTEGRKAGYSAVAGVALGLAVIGVIAALGLASVINASPLAFQTLRFAGVGYLLWLAWEGWHGEKERASRAAPGSPPWRYFQRGLITNLLNPKAAAFFISILPGFVVPNSSVTQQTVTLTAIYVAVATLIHACLVTAAGAAQVWLDNPARAQIIRRILSLALVAIAFWFLWKTRS